MPHSTVEVFKKLFRVKLSHFLFRTGSPNHTNERKKKINAFENQRASSATVRKIHHSARTADIRVEGKRSVACEWSLLKFSVLRRNALQNTEKSATARRGITFAQLRLLPPRTLSEKECVNVVVTNDTWLCPCCFHAYLAFLFIFCPHERRRQETSFGRQISCVCVPFNGSSFLEASTALAAPASQLASAMPLMKARTEWGHARAESALLFRAAIKGDPLFF